MKRKKRNIKIYWIIGILSILLIGTAGLYLFFNSDHPLTYEEFTSLCYNQNGAHWQNENGTFCACPTGIECDTEDSSLTCPIGQLCYQDGIGSPFHGLCRDKLNPIQWNNKMEYFSC